MFTPILLHIFVVIFAVTVVAETPAYNYAGSPDYPNATAWKALGEVLGPAFVKCEPGTGGSEACGASTARADYAVLARTAQDVSAAMKFASDNRIRVTIRNTGHDFMARHSGAGGITILVKGLSEIEAVDVWTPKAGNLTFLQQSAAVAQSAAIIGAGNSWSTVSTTLRAVGKIAVHGAQGTVGVGGWTMGGGHGPYSTVFGLGCDNVLEYEVVLANGTLVIANEDSHPDLFWAMRGGGGGTFGVMTRMTVKTYALPKVESMSLAVSGPRDSYLDAMSYYFAKTPEISDFGITAYPLMSNVSYSGMLSAPGKTAAELRTFLMPIVERMKSYNATVTFGPGVGRSLYRDDGSFAIPDVLDKTYAQLQTQNLAKRQLPDFSVRHDIPVTTLASRLLARSQLTEENLPAIRTMLKYLTGYLLPYPNMGGRVTQNRNLDTGLNPAFRDAVMLLIVINYGREQNVKVMDPLSPNHASYWNEASDDEKEWKTTFFGPADHYNRLLEVKQKYDPHKTLWCHPCVGSDSFIQREGKLYIAGT